MSNIFKGWWLSFHLHIQCSSDLFAICSILTLHDTSLSRENKNLYATSTHSRNLSTYAFFYKLLLRTCLSLSLTRCLLSVYFIIIQLEAFVVKWHYGKEEGTAIMNIVSGPLPTIEPRRYFGTRRHIATICRMFLTPFNVVLSQQCHRQLLLRRIIAW